MTLIAVLVLREAPVAPSLPGVPRSPSESRKNCRMPVARIIEAATCKLLDSAQHQMANELVGT